MNKLHLTLALAATVVAVGVLAPLRPARAEDFAALLAKGKWIWYDEGDPATDAPAETRYFLRTIKIDADRDIKNAVFLLTCDNGFELFVNGAKICDAHDWNTAVAADIKAKLVKGDNVIAVAGTNDDGPAGLIGAIKVDYSAGDPLTVGTDDKWMVANKKIDGWEKPGFTCKPDDWKKAKVMGDYGMDPWGTNVALP
jgi:alpha-L-rhamnosidase